jgi:hypothetical protein
VEALRSDTLAITESPDSAVIDLPPNPPSLRLNAPTRRGRIGAWVSLLLIIGFTAGVACAAGFVVRDLRRKLPLEGPVAPWSIACLAFIGFMFGSGTLVPLAAALAFFAERRTIRVSGGWILDRYRRGPCGWTRRVDASSIRRILVTVPARATERSLRRPLAVQPARLLLEEDEEMHALGPSQLPRPLALALADQLSRQLARLRPHEPPPPVIDAMDPDWLNAAVAEPPPEVRLSVERNEGATRIRILPPPFTVWQLLRDPEARVGLWVMLLPWGLVAAIPWLPPECVPLHHGLRVVALIFSGLGLLMLALVLVARLGTVTLTVDVGALRSRRRRWDRADITAIRAAFRSGKENATRCVVEVLRRGGPRATLVSGSPPLIRYLAATLRQTLGVPSDPPKDRISLHPGDADWHLQDDPEPPADCPFVSSRFPGGIVIHKPAAGLARGRGALLGVCVAVFLLIAPALAVGWRFIDAPKDRGAAVELALFFAVFALASAVGIAHDARDQYEFVAGAGRLDLSRRRLRRRRFTRWEPGQIVAITTEPTSPTGRTARMRIWTDHRRCYMLSGEPRAMRHLATLLRQALAVSAVDPVE